jgi:hypothetical protein
MPIENNSVSTSPTGCLNNTEISTSVLGCQRVVIRSRRITVSKVYEERVGIFYYDTFTIDAANQGLDLIVMLKEMTAESMCYVSRYYNYCKDAVFMRKDAVWLVSVSPVRNYDYIIRLRGC